MKLDSEIVGHELKLNGHGLKLSNILIILSNLTFVLLDVGAGLIACTQRLTRIRFFKWKTSFRFTRDCQVACKLHLAIRVFLVWQPLNP